MREEGVARACVCKGGRGEGVRREVFMTYHSLPWVCLAAWC